MVLNGSRNTRPLKSRFDVGKRATTLVTYGFPELASVAGPVTGPEYVLATPCTSRSTSV